jgi:nicotinate-nucleotide pyrophosphorylase (carboxylating)
MTASISPISVATVLRDVDRALEEDVGDGDITATLLPEQECGEALIITRDPGVLCGRPWADAVFNRVDERILCEWQAQDGDPLEPGQALVTLRGPVRGLLTAERSAMNFLQTLSGTATVCRRYADAVADLPVRLLDTRKTLPGLREAQKYAVRCGGCYNHRMGLFDAFLIKENHILACGGIGPAVLQARAQHPDKPVEVEVESLDELAEALNAEVERIMLDNFDLDGMRKAVQTTAGRAELEASGNVSLQTLRPIAETGVDFISIGALTKDCQALDLSMRLR